MRGFLHTLPTFLLAKLLQRHEKLIVSQTAYSTVIRWKGGSLCVAEFYKGIGFVKLVTRLRKEVKSRRDIVQLYPQSVNAPRFYHVNRANVTSGRREILQYDLEKAYLNAALKLGAISGETYKRMQTYHKTTRLALIGSLGTKKIVRTYENGKLIKEEMVSDEYLTNVWRSICISVDKRMQEVLSMYKRSTIFYWVDALFSFDALPLPSDFVESKFEAIMRHTKEMLIIEGAKKYVVPIYDHPEVDYKRRIIQ